MLVRLKNISPGVRVVYDAGGQAHTIPRGRTSRQIEIPDLILGRVTAGAMPMFRIVGEDEAEEPAAADPATAAEQPAEGEDAPQPPVSTITAAEVLKMHEASPLGTQDLTTYVREICGLSLNGTPRRTVLIQHLRDKAEHDATLAAAEAQKVKRRAPTTRATSVKAKRATRVKLRA